MVFPQRFLYSMGIGGFFVALIAAAIALIVLPAVLTLLGARVNSLTPGLPRAPRRARRAARRRGLLVPALAARDALPGRIAATTAALLIALGLPFFGIQFTSVDAQVLPESASARQVDDVLRSRVPALSRHADHARGRGERRGPVAGGRGRACPAVAVAPPPRGCAAAPTRSTWSPAPRRSTTAARSSCATCARSAGDALVTGQTAGFLDLQDSLVDHLPLVLAIVAR